MVRTLRRIQSMDPVSRAPEEVMHEPPRGHEQIDAIEAFLTSDRIALVGASLDPNHFSRSLWTELRTHGRDIIPVNPNGGQIDGIATIESLEEISPEPEAVYIAVSGDSAVTVLRQCKALGLRKVWLHRGGPGPGSTSLAAAECIAGLDFPVVYGQCILMFLEPVHWVHRVHRGLKRVMGTLPT